MWFLLKQFLQWHFLEHFSSFKSSETLKAYPPRQLTYPPKNGILKMMIFQTSRLVGYVSIPWKLTIFLHPLRWRWANVQSSTLVGALSIRNAFQRLPNMLCYKGIQLHGVFSYITYRLTSHVSGSSFMLYRYYICIICCCSESFWNLGICQETDGQIAGIASCYLAANKSIAFANSMSFRIMLRNRRWKPMKSVRDSVASNCLL